MLEEVQRKDMKRRQQKEEIKERLRMEEREREKTAMSIYI